MIQNTIMSLSEEGLNNHLSQAYERTFVNEKLQLHQFSSFKGRAYCVYNAVYHLIETPYAILELAVIGVVGVIAIPIIALLARPCSYIGNGELFGRACLLILYVPFLPCLQICKIFNAVAGVFHPGAYYQAANVREMAYRANSKAELARLRAELDRLEEPRLHNQNYARIRWNYNQPLALHPIAPEA